MVQTITAVIPAKNEEKNITRCIKSLDFCDRVIVIWMGNDKTGEIAKKLGAEVIKKNFSKKDDFRAVQKNINWVIDNCNTDWILRVDADEVVSDGLKNEIIFLLTKVGGNEKKVGVTSEVTLREADGRYEVPSLAVEKGSRVTESTFFRYKEIVAFGIPRKPFFLGAFLKGGDWAYDRLVRLFRPQFARYDPIVEVHELFKVKGEIGYLKNSILHYSHPDLKTIFRKFNSYTDVQIKEINDSLHLALLKMLVLPAYIFLRWTIWHLGIRDKIGRA